MTYEKFCSLRRTETLLRNGGVHILQHYERKKWYIMFRAGNLRLRRVKGCIRRARCPLCAEIKVNFTLLPRHKGTYWSKSMVVLFI